MTEVGDTQALPLDGNLAKIVIDGVGRVFRLTFGVDVKPAKVFHKVGYQGHGDISAVLGMAQTKVEATLTVSFPKPTIIGVLSIIYGPLDKITDSVKDGVGEVTNVIYGYIKKELNGRGYNFQMAIPNVVVGENHSIQAFSSASSMIIPFSCRFGTFYVSITIQDHK